MSSIPAWAAFLAVWCAGFNVHSAQQKKGEKDQVVAETEVPPLKHPTSVCRTDAGNGRSHRAVRECGRHCSIDPISDM